MLLPTKMRSRFETLNKLLKMLLTTITKVTITSCANSMPRVKYNKGKPIDFCVKTMEKYAEKPSPWIMPKNVARTKNGSDGLQKKKLVIMASKKIAMVMIVRISSSDDGLRKSNGDDGHDRNKRTKR